MCGQYCISSAKIMSPSSSESVTESTASASVKHHSITFLISCSFYKGINAWTFSGRDLSLTVMTARPRSSHRALAYRRPFA